MAKLDILKATTNVTLYVFIQDSTAADNGGLTGLVFNSAGLTCYFVRPLAAATVLTLATQTVTGAHSDGGFVEVDSTNMPGIYRLDLSDAVCAAGVNSVVVHLKGATNMVPVTLEIQLTSYNPNDATRLGLTALPNAAADAAGGLPISDAGALDLDLYLKSGVVLAGTASAGSATTITMTGGVATDNYYNGALVIITGGTGVGQSRTILDYVGSSTVATITRDWATAPDATSTFVVIGADVPAILEAGTAQAGAANNITLDAGASAIDETYTNNFVMITGGTGIGQTRLIGIYNGTTKVAVITPPWTTTPDSTSVYQILPAARVDVGGWLGNLVTGDGDWAELQTDLDAVLALLDDPRGEPGQGAPAVNPDAMTKIDYLYKAWRNKKDNDGSTTQLYADDTTTVDHKQTTSEAGGTVTKDEWVTGP